MLRKVSVPCRAFRVAAVACQESATASSRRTGSRPLSSCLTDASNRRPSSVSLSSSLHLLSSPRRASSSDASSVGAEPLAFSEPKLAKGSPARDRWELASLQDALDALETTSPFVNPSDIHTFLDRWDAELHQFISPTSLSISSPSFNHGGGSPSSATAGDPWPRLARAIRPFGQAGQRVAWSYCLPLLSPQTSRSITPAFARFAFVTVRELDHPDWATLEAVTALYRHCYPEPFVRASAWGGEEKIMDVHRGDLLEATIWTFAKVGRLYGPTKIGQDPSEWPSPRSPFSSSSSNSASAKAYYTLLNPLLAEIREARLWLLPSFHPTAVLFIKGLYAFPSGPSQVLDTYEALWSGCGDKVTSRDAKNAYGTETARRQLLSKAGATIGRAISWTARISSEVEGELIPAKKMIALAETIEDGGAALNEKGRLTTGGRHAIESLVRSCIALLQRPGTTSERLQRQAQVVGQLEEVRNWLQRRTEARAKVFREGSGSDNPYDASSFYEFLLEAYTLVPGRQATVLEVLNQTLELPGGPTPRTVEMALTSVKDDSTLARKLIASILTHSPTLISSPSWQTYHLSLVQSSQWREALRSICLDQPTSTPPSSHDVLDLFAALEAQGLTEEERETCARAVKAKWGQVWLRADLGEGIRGRTREEASNRWNRTVGGELRKEAARKAWLQEKRSQQQVRASDELMSKKETVGRRWLDEKGRQGGGRAAWGRDRDIE